MPVVPFKDGPKYLPYNENGLRGVKFASQDRINSLGETIPANGFASAFLKVGGRVFIDTDRFLEIMYAKNALPYNKSSTPNTSSSHPLVPKLLPRSKKKKEVTTEYSEVDLNELDTFLRNHALPGGCPNICQLHGFATAQFLDLEPLSFVRVASTVLGETIESKVKWQSEEQLERIADLFGRYWAHVESTLPTATPANFMSYFNHAAFGESLVLGFMHWSEGFMRSVNLNTTPWEHLLDTIDDPRSILDSIVHFGSERFKRELTADPALGTEPADVQSLVGIVEALPQIVPLVRGYWINLAERVTKKGRKAKLPDDAPGLMTNADAPAPTIRNRRPS